MRSIYRQWNVSGISCRGLTAIEMLIWLAAIAVVLLVSIPGASLYLENHRLKKASGNLFNSLELARGEAFVRSSTVRVCPSSNGRTCRSDGDWNFGWLVFSDGNADGAVQDIEVIEVFEAPDRHVEITARGAVQTMASFNAGGLVQGNGSRSGEFEVCLKDSGGEPRIVAVEQGGWTKLVPPTTRACQSG